MNRSTREITTSLWAITAALQEHLEEAGLDDARIDAVVTRGLGKLRLRGSRLQRPGCGERRPAEVPPKACRTPVRRGDARC
jgi:hypothetical protein